MACKCEAPPIPPPPRLAMQFLGPTLGNSFCDGCPMQEPCRCSFFKHALALLVRSEDGTAHHVRCSYCTDAEKAYLDTLLAPPIAGGDA